MRRLVWDTSFRRAFKQRTRRQPSLQERILDVLKTTGGDLPTVQISHATVLLTAQQIIEAVRQLDAQEREQVLGFARADAGKRRKPSLLGSRAQLACSASSLG